MPGPKKRNGFSIQYIKELLSGKSEFLLEEFSKIIKTSNNKRKCENIIKSQLQPDELISVLVLLTNIPWSILDSGNFNISRHLISNQFYDNIVRFLTKLQENNCYNKKDFFVLIKFYEIIMAYIPICEETYEKFLTLFEMSYNCLGKLVLTSPTELFLYERMEELVKLLLFKVYYIERNQWHYSYMNIYPSPVDFYEIRNLLPNIIKGSYESADHYLDIHFKILKEDFVCAVREGIEQHRLEMSGAKEKKNSSMHFYKNVASNRIFIDKKNVKSKIYHEIIFSEEDTKMLQEENFQDTKKFMNGSLLFFTRNDFTTFVVATVEYIDWSKKKFSNIKVSVIGNPYLLKTNTTYNMIEPVTFFEPYFQSLKNLQSINPSNFPLVKNIVFTDMKPVDSGKKIQLEKNNNLNPSQVNALTTALSQKFSIIQGPPGTGKSYLARAIIDTLTKNRNPHNYPILVICARNNALDLVLEPLVSLKIKIVRLGSQSKSEILTERTLHNLRKKWRTASCFSKQLLLTKIKQYRDIILASENVNCPEAIEDAVQGYGKASEALNFLLQYHDANQIISHGIHVIGATTAGAMRYQRMLSYIKPKVVIIEEAAEIMEPIIVSSIPEGCDHVILIGDHLQLQPTPAWHPSTMKYKMNISLFERMIRNGMEYQQLMEQHRMRPEIAQLISPLVYQNLLNHPSVCNYPDVRGMANNVFFLNHEIEEDEIDDDSESHWSFHEADFVLALADYLVKQDYQPSEITILATYSAQHQHMKNVSETEKFSAIKGVQIQVVDNYQGEENNIILLSLVRSNSPTVGFLSQMNRINVALSRAKHGLFIIGNMKTLSRCDSWMKINNILKSENIIDNMLPLKCETHKKITKVSNQKQLLGIKYGGCNLRCKFKLKCGHVCPYPCHGSKKLHELPCNQTCLRLKVCGHRCKAKCFEDCETLLCNVNKVFTLNCGHYVTAQCTHNFTDYQCMDPCNKLLPCGHECQFPCYKECGPWPCTELVPNTFVCGHKETVVCSDISSHKCMQQCRKLNSCGMHRCQKPCSVRCGSCVAIVEVMLHCGHIAKVQCSNPISKDLYRCQELVKAISDSCKHPYYQVCFEKNNGIKYEGKCLMGCSQNPDKCIII